MTSASVTELTRCLEQSGAVVHRCTHESARRLIPQRAVALAAGGDIALSPADSLLEELDVLDALTRAGACTLTPDDAAWSECIARAGVGVTGAVLGVAATGSLVMANGTGIPRATHIVPPSHLCVVRGADVVASFADAIAAVGAAPLASNVSWVGGPSRTADLEMQPTIGVHGPTVLEVVVVEPAPT